jgi:hypothetical protein
MFVHHVFFWMSPDASDADRAQLRAGLQSLTAVDTIRQWHIGAPADTDRPVIERSYAFSWLLIFDSAADEAVYQTHPLHLDFIEKNAHLWTKVIVYDSVGVL